MPPKSTEPTLIRDAKAGNQTAKENLLAWIGPLINHWCHELTEQDRQDVIHDVFVAMFENIKGFDRTPRRSFRGWVRTITSNTIADLYRGKMQKPQAVGGDVAYGRLLQQAIQQIDQDDDNDAAILLWQAVEQIRDEFQASVFEAFLLSTIEGLTASEIQTKLGMNPNAIQQAKFRVRGRLREVYGDLVS